MEDIFDDVKEESARMSFWDFQAVLGLILWAWVMLDFLLVKIGVYEAILINFNR
jgi:hypothetical protein